MTTPAQREFAMKRIYRLGIKLVRIDRAIAASAHSGHPNDVESRRLLKRELVSTTTAIKRWQKKLDSTGGINEKA